MRAASWQNCLRFPWIVINNNSRNKNNLVLGSKAMMMIYSIPISCRWPRYRSRANSSSPHSDESRGIGVRLASSQIGTCKRRVTSPTHRESEMKRGNCSRWRRWSWWWSRMKFDLFLIYSEIKINFRLRWALARANANTKRIQMEDDDANVRRIGNNYNFWRVLARGSQRECLIRAFVCTTPLPKDIKSQFEAQENRGHSFERLHRRKSRMAFFFSEFNSPLCAVRMQLKMCIEKPSWPVSFAQNIINQFVCTQSAHCSLSKQWQTFNFHLFFVRVENAKSPHSVRRPSPKIMNTNAVAFCSRRFFCALIFLTSSPPAARHSFSA